MKAKSALIAFLLLLFCFSFAKSTFATAPVITVYPLETLGLDSAFTVTATMSGLSKSAIYRLRVAISPGTSNYFGSTYDGSTWHMGSIADGNFVSITTDGNGVWGGDIQGKIDSDDPNFTTGSGMYDLKIGRYTQTGSTATWSDPKNIEIVVPLTPTPTNSPTPTFKPTNTPTPTVKPTNTPTVTKAISKTPTPTVTIPPSENKDVLANSTKSSVNNFEKAKTDNKKDDIQKNNNFLPIIFILIGVVFLLACVIVIFYPNIKNYLNKENE